ncbi:MSHA biogenesis protein MshK [Syntrophotalea acetylenivorans]|nr:MSHA biogenesis protein MshK [Syntrophotalea acetylenivorans]
MAVFVCAGMLAMLMPADKGNTASLPDPTRPPQRFVEPAASGDAPSKGLQLGSILIAPQRRVAVINGRPLSAGDRISGAKVVAIEPGQVRLRRGGRDFVLKLLPKRPKVTAVAEKD